MLLSNLIDHLFNEENTVIKKTGWNEPVVVRAIDRNGGKYKVEKVEFNEETKQLEVILSDVLKNEEDIEQEVREEIKKELRVDEDKVEEKELRCFKCRKVVEKFQIIKDNKGYCNAVCFLAIN